MANKSKATFKSGVLLPGLLILAGFTTSTDSRGELGDYVSTASKEISRINIQSSDNGAIYYFIAEDNGWSAQDCPNALIAYIAESDHGAEVIMSIALAAKMTASPVRFEGTCGNSNGNDQYIEIVRIELQ